MIFNKKKKSQDNDISINNIVKDSNLSHIAFIMDGNGRWAKKRGLVREAGHGVGIVTLKKIILLCRDFGINTVTVYAFSTENWKRPKNEVNEIMRLLSFYVDESKDDDEKNKIKYVFIGDKSRLDDELRNKCIELEEITKNHTFTVYIAVNYGGRDEIVHAVNQFYNNGGENITSEDISQNLYTSGSTDPDLIVRTGGEYRLSNFLMWQSAYSELYITECLWPDYNELELRKAIIEFSQRQRRFGGV